METREGINLQWNRHWFISWWNEEFKDLEFAHEPFNNPEDLKQWQELGYTQTRFTGDLYDMRNPQPKWIDRFLREVPWDNIGWSVYRMPPGTVLPEHSDTYSKYREIYGIEDINTVQRMVVFLEDWQSGHYFEIDGNPITGWKKGEYVSWNSTVPHVAANVGKTNRYTLQLTGTKRGGHTVVKAGAEDFYNIKK